MTTPPCPMSWTRKRNKRGAARYDDPDVANASGGDASDVGTFERNPTSPVAVEPAVSSTTLRLAAPKPNPTAGETTFGYALPRRCNDLQGRRVRTLLKRVIPAG